MGPFESEFHQRFSGRYFGKYRGIVEDVADPRSLGRIKVRCPVVAGDEVLGWCYPAAAGGGGVNNGQFWLPVKEDFVWVEFEEGDPSRAIWSGGPWGNRDDEPMSPKHARGVTDDEDVLNRNLGPIPPSSFAGESTFVRGLRSKSGHFLEFDDTVGAERVQLFHKVGSRLEFQRDGSIQLVAVGGMRTRFQGSLVEEYGKNHDMRIGGNRQVVIEGQESLEVKKDSAYSYQNVNVEGLRHTAAWGGDHDTLVGGSFKLRVASQASFQSGGQMAFMVGQNFQGTVLETFELAASNATGLPTSNVILLHGYNGKVLIKSTDPTGLVPLAEMKVELDYLLGMLFQAGTPGGSIQLTNTPVAHIHLGGLGVTEPFVLGTQLATMLTTVLTDLATHVHPTGVGPSGPPITAAVYAAQAGLVPTLLSLRILGA